MPADKSFHSILFEDIASRAAVEGATEPAFFKDLHLDQVVEAIVKGREEYDLKPFFHVPLPSVAAIEYRQEIVRDLRTRAIFSHATAFAEMMKDMREQLQLASKSYYPLQKQRWFLQAVDTYFTGVLCLARDLGLADLHSQGLLLLRAYLTSYTQSSDFTAMVAEARQLEAELRAIQYRLRIHGPLIEVSRYESEPDYEDEVAKTFEKFRQGATKDYAFELSRDTGMNHVEAAILERVAQLFPQTFSALEQFCHDRAGYLDETLRSFDREVQFYLATLGQVEPLEKGGVAFCLPTVSETDKELECREVFDWSLATQLQGQIARLVRNDFHLQDRERILVVSGANQGGKTTFARTVGQLHYLAALGCPVPASRARLFLFDRLFSHFEREEDLSRLHSKLEDDLVRIHQILQQASSRSLLIMNESFSSATLQDALFLGREVMREVMARDLLCVFVTFLDELSTLGEQTVSMVSTVKADDPSQRSFKLVRMPADGLAYAAAVAQKYGLTYESVKQRVAS